MNFDVSVIVPVYGVEQYIQNCVDHLLNQTLENLSLNQMQTEEVLADAGYSSGESLKYCKERGINA